MVLWRFHWRGILLVLVCAVLISGCWGRKFFRMPRETIDTSTKVDSLLRENAKLQKRMYLVEKTLEEQRDYTRSANAQLKIDLEEFKDQVNALLQKLGEVQSGSSREYDIGRVRTSDTASVETQAGDATGEENLHREDRETVPEAESASEAPSPDTAAVLDAEPGREQIDPADTAVVHFDRAIPPPDEIHRQIYLDFSRGEYQLALEDSELFLREYSDHPLGEEVHFIRGECFMEQEKYFDALKEFSLILRQYPRGRRVPATLFRMAVSYESIGEKEIAAGVVRRLIREHPYSEEAGAAEERFGDLGMIRTLSSTPPTPGGSPGNPKRLDRNRTYLSTTVGATGVPSASFCNPPTTT